MRHLPAKWPTPIILAMAGAAVAALITVTGVRFLDELLNSSTGVFAMLCALIAVGRLAHRPLPRWNRAFWLLALVLAAMVASLEFAEPLAKLKGHDFAFDNVDDVLLLAAGPVGLWLTSRVARRAIDVHLLLTAGLAAQLGGALLDLRKPAAAAAFGLAPDRVQSYADFAQFLSLLFYLLTMWLLVGRGARSGEGGSTETAGRSPLPTNGRGVPGSPRDTLYPPPFLIGLGLADLRSPAGRVHRLCNDAVWPDGDILCSARNLGTMALWPVIAAVRAVPELRHYGDAVRRLTGKSYLRQFVEQMIIAIRYRIAPMYYYVYELFRRGQWRSAPYYLMRYETKEIAYRLLYPAATAQCEPTPLKNKMAFARCCAVNGIPHVPVLMLFEDGLRASAPGLAQELPEADVFSKRVFGKGGVRSQLWRFLGPASYRNMRGQVMDAPALVAHLCHLSKTEPYILQRAVKNRPDLSELSAGALCTVRVLSCRNEASGFEVTNASFRMSVDPRSPVDNFHAGGIAAAIDIATGGLGRATSLGRGNDFGWYDRHPLTGAQITGRQLPMWRDTLDLAVRAHLAFPDHVLVGWDVAILEDGPCVIEGNRGPDVDLIQRPLGAPIGDGRFGELLAFNLARRGAVSN